jgi:NTE family protein
MGGVHFGYEFSADYPLSDAMAASAGFPVAIGPLTLKTTGRKWEEYIPGTRNRTREISARFKKVHLWDGGVYDNLGLEPLDRPDVKQLFVSNASGKMDAEKRYRPGVGALVRLISIAKYQIEALRGRATIHNYISHNLGGQYFNMGNSCQKILRAALGQPGGVAGYQEDDIPVLCNRYLTPEAAEQAANMPTEIANLSEEEFRLLFRHGYEVADCTMFAYGKGTHRLIGYDTDKWNAIFAS